MKPGSPEYQRARYQKFREKRLAEKREEYWNDPDKLRERNKAQYAANRDKRVEYAREYRRRNREQILEKKAAEWLAKRDIIKERRKGHKIDEEGRRAYAREWLKRNPDKAIVAEAKRLINEQTGMAIRDIPEELAEAKAEQLKITRWVREHLAAQADRNPEGHDPAEGHGRNDESPVAAISGDAPEGISRHG